MVRWRDGREHLLSRGPDPVLVVELLQSAKAALAGVLAWWIAIDVLGLQQPFLAPWAAVLVVHTTVYRTFSRGGQQIGATFAGVFLAWACGSLFGVGPGGMAVLLVVAFLAGRIPWLRDEATTIATTGIVVLATNAIGDSNLLAGRFLDTSVGVVVGLLVNLLVWPPLRDRAAWARAAELPHELSEVLASMAGAMSSELGADVAREWTDRLGEVDGRIDEAWGLLRQARESGRMNPRRSRPEGLDDLVRILHLLEQAVADTMSMARTLTTSAENATLWGEDFRDPWTRLLAGTADAVDHQNVAALHEIRAGLTRFAGDLSTDTLPGSAWYEYGGMLVNLRNVVGALTEVTELGSGTARTPRRRKRGPEDLRLPRRPRGYSGGEGHRTKGTA